MRKAGVKGERRGEERTRERSSSAAICLSVCLSVFSEHEGQLTPPPGRVSEATSPSQPPVSLSANALGRLPPFEEPTPNAYLLVYNGR